MPEPTLRERRSARTRPANTLRETIARYSSFFKNCSSKRSRRPASAAVRAGAPFTSHLLGRALEDLADHAVRIDALGLALEIQNESVAERARRHPPDVLT